MHYLCNIVLAPHYNAPLYLDCCGLVRRVLLDLKEDFGFTIGRWNQAYMYDTLPIELDGPEEMKPGDLVFVSAVYNNLKCKYFNSSTVTIVTPAMLMVAKQQKHNMVHVEIWLGDGNRTVGARWQKGVVEVHDSYEYVSKSYHSMKYHFHSIDTWLNGICKSFCNEHPWRLNKRTMPGKKSIFSCQQEEEESNEIQQFDDEQSDPINKPDESSQDQSSSASSDDNLSGQYYIMMM